MFFHKRHNTIIASLLLIAFLAPKQLLSQNSVNEPSERHHLILVFDNSLSTQAAWCLKDGATINRTVSLINKKYDILRDSNDFYSIVNYAVGDLMYDFSQVALPSKANGKPLAWQAYNDGNLTAVLRMPYILFQQGHDRAVENSMKEESFSWNSGIEELALYAARKPSSLETVGAEKTYMIIFKDDVSAGGNFQREADNIFGKRANELFENYKRLYFPIHKLYTFNLVETKKLNDGTPIYKAELYEVGPANSPNLSTILDNGTFPKAKQTHKGYRIKVDCKVKDTINYCLIDATLNVAEEKQHGYAIANTVQLEAELPQNLFDKDSIATILSCRAVMLDTMYGGMIVSPQTYNCSALSQVFFVPRPKKATIFGFTMPQWLWLWHPNDAQKAAQTWQWIVMTLLILAATIIVRNRIKRNSVFQPSDKDISLISGKHSNNGLAIPIGEPTAKPISLGDYSIEVRRPKERYFNVNKKPQASLEVKVGNISWNTDDEIKYDKNKLFSLKVNSNTGYVESTVEIDDYSTGVELYVNPSAIADIRRPQDANPRVYTLSADLLLSNAKKTISRLPVKFSINIERIKPQITVEIELDRPYNAREGFRYDATKGNNTPIGRLIISNKNRLQYCPDTILKLKTKISKDGVSSNALQINGIGPAMQEHIKNEEIIEYPIVADFNILGNPMGERDIYSIEASLECQFVGCGKEKVDIIEKKDWTVLANVDDIALRVSVKTGHDTERITNGATKELPQLLFTPNGGNLQLGYPICIENTAQNGYEGTGIIVKNLSQTIDIYPKHDDGTEAVTIDFSSADLNTEKVFAITGNDVQALKKGVLLQSTHDHGRQRQINIGFCTEDIRHIRHEYGDKRMYFMTVRHTIQFKYYIDRTGNGAQSPKEYQDYAFVVEYRVEQAPYPEWLAVDFGTSAIVARYGDNDGVVNLHEQKDKYLKKLNDKDTVHEPETPFLSSNAAMRGNVLDDYRKSKSQLLQDYDVAEGLPNIDLLTVSLSATPRTEDSNIKYLLPTLKQLVGYEMLPNLEGFEDLTYNYYDADTKAIIESAKVFDSNANTHTRLAEIQTVLTEIFAQLFRYYIGPALGSSRLDLLNKIVLTVPNTFTPNHIHSVKEIVLKSMRQFDIREIRFVSESDAVACFYEGHRASLRKTELPQKAEDEHILVYDMGAGTLDLTYFRSRTAPDGTRELDSLGRIGVSKAGNYLDALLAECMANEYEDLDGLTWKNQLVSSDDLLKARRLKEFIKDKVKPQIGKEEPLRVSVSEGKLIGLNLTKDTDLNIKEVFTSKERFKAYLDECTKGIVEKFFTMIGKAQPEVDTLILSGRSARLNGIKDHLIDALKVYGVNTSNLEVIDLCQNKNEELTKTAVAQGAEYYARLCTEERQNAAILLHSKYISACYGLIFKGSDGGMKYAELLNPYIETPIDEQISDGIIIQTFDTKAKSLDLRWADEIILVQTYSNNTASDWEKGKTEYISEMARYRVDALPNRRNAQISLRVDGSGRMEIKIAEVGNATMNPTRIDIQSDSNRMSLWPMLS